jgi:hypothetical protein
VLHLPERGHFSVELLAQPHRWVFFEPIASRNCSFTRTGDGQIEPIGTGLLPTVGDVPRNGGLTGCNALRCGRPNAGEVRQNAGRQNKFSTSEGEQYGI